MNRKLKYKVYDQLYSVFHESSKCYYCGDLVAGFDHCPPLHYTWTKGTDYLYENRIPMYKVSCCSDCNSSLGNRFYGSLQGRAEYIYTRLHQRFLEQLASPYWSNKEIQELDSSLRIAIENNELVRGWLERRFKWLREVHLIPLSIKQDCLDLVLTRQYELKNERLKSV